MKVCSFRLHIEPRQLVILPPYKGATLRGGFGSAFKKIVCTLKEKDCAECILKEQCVYSYVFETSPPNGAKVMRKYPSVPHPFVIEPPPEKKMGYKNGDGLTFGLTLIGRAIDYLPYFIYTFDELGNMGIGKGRGKYTLKTVFQKSTNGAPADHGTLIYSSETRKLSSFNPEAITMPSSLLMGTGGHVPEARQGSVRVPGITDEGDFSTTTSKPSPSTGEGSGEGDFSTTTSKPSPLTGEGSGEGDLHSVTLNFLTPTRIYYSGKLTCDLEFHILISQLLRRISMLAYFHCGIDISDWDFKGIIAKAKEVTIIKNNLRWYGWQRYSSRQDQKINMGGFVGEITYEGNIAPFLTMLRAGEILHVGKSATFGLGRYEICNGSSVIPAQAEIRET